MRMVLKSHPQWRAQWERGTLPDEIVGEDGEASSDRAVVREPLRHLHKDDLRWDEMLPVRLEKAMCRKGVDFQEKRETVVLMTRSHEHERVGLLVDRNEPSPSNVRGLRRVRWRPTFSLAMRMPFFQNACPHQSENHVVGHGLNGERSQITALS